MQLTSSAALAAGIAVALIFGNPWPDRTREGAHRLLAISVVGLGAGMDLGVVGRVGAHGLLYTAAGIAMALGLGTWLGRRLGVARDTSLLVSVGTSICGGSAIAAVAPAIRAKGPEVSVSLAAVFVLNAVALLLFPVVGRALHMSQDAFGLWSALAIHDTSSVAGAAAQYGPRALEVAMAAKLARALWIVPVTFGAAFVRARTDRPSSESRPRFPWFIGGFLVTAALATYLPAFRPAGRLVASGSHIALTLTLFLVGLGLSRPALRSIGAKPMLQAIALWVALGAGSLCAILRGWVG